jgi:hypothetical protein
MQPTHVKTQTSRRPSLTHNPTTPSAPTTTKNIDTNALTSVASKSDDVRNNVNNIDTMMMLARIIDAITHPQFLTPPNLYPKYPPSTIPRMYHKIRGPLT